MLDYPLLAALAAVIREGGFERAAARLGVTPSAVSQRIRALEERVGAALVVRSQPPVPTEAGARLCAHVERVRLLEGELAADLPALAGPGPGAPALPVAVNADSLGSWFLPAAARFSEATGALVHLLLDDEAHTAARLRSGEVLAAVTADPAAVPGCRTRPLGALRYVACASLGFMARHFPQGVTAAALAHAPVSDPNLDASLDFEGRVEVQGGDVAGVAQLLEQLGGAQEPELARLLGEARTRSLDAATFAQIGRAHV